MCNYERLQWRRVNSQTFCQNTAFTLAMNLHFPTEMKLPKVWKPYPSATLKSASRRPVRKSKLLKRTAKPNYEKTYFVLEISKNSNARSNPENRMLRVQKCGWPFICCDALHVYDSRKNAESERQKSNSWSLIFKAFNNSIDLDWQTNEKNSPGSRFLPLHYENHASELIATELKTIQFFYFYFSLTTIYDLLQN